MFYVLRLFKIHFDEKLFPSLLFSLRRVNFSRFLSGEGERKCLVGGFDHDSWMLNCADADADEGTEFKFSQKKSSLHSDSSIFLGAFFAPKNEWHVKECSNDA